MHVRFLFVSKIKRFPIIPSMHVAAGTDCGSSAANIQFSRNRSKRSKRDQTLLFKTHFLLISSHQRICNMTRLTQDPLFTHSRIPLSYKSHFKMANLSGSKDQMFKRELERFIDNK